MKGVKYDLIRLAAIRRREIFRTAITRPTASRVATYRDERRRQVSSGTAIRELAYLSAIINYARRDWGIQARALVLGGPLNRSKLLSNRKVPSFTNCPLLAWQE